MLNVDVPLYIFGYGSLMWNPGFEFTRKWVFELKGFHRSASVYSWKYRGTPESPGLVLGLERGGSCRGIIFEVRPELKDATYKQVLLRERGQRLPHEQTWTPIYEETWVDFEIPSEAKGKALAFVCNVESPQYAGRLADKDKAKLLAFSRGENGTSLEYFESLIQEFAKLGISDPGVEVLLRTAKSLLNSSRQ